MDAFIKIFTALFVAVFCLSPVVRIQAEADSALSSQKRAIIPIAAFTASGNLFQLEKALSSGLNAGLTVNEIREILVHSYAYAGFPRALNAINTCMAVLEKRKEQGIIDKDGKEATAMPSDFDKDSYGHKVRNSLVGRDLTKPPSGYSVFAPVIDKFLVEHLFADIFYRDVLSHQDRELVTISILAAMTGTEAQLRTHLQISLNVGMTKAQLDDYVSVLKLEVGTQSAERAAETMNDLFGKAGNKNLTRSVEVIKKGTPAQGSKENFTGNVTVESRFSSGNPGGYGGAIVNFEAGARTAWHKHPFGQTLVVISGCGLIQSEGEEIQKILPGDVVWIPADEKHWHGAARDSSMSHVAISESPTGEAVDWLEHVSDEQYGKPLN